MERDGVLENRQSAQDGRVRTIALTEQGRKRYELVRDLTMLHVSRILHDLSHKDRGKLLDMIGQMQANTENRTLDN
jgi:DNA-binding MarR family transcriptional regulator